MGQRHVSSRDIVDLGRVFSDCAIQTQRFQHPMSKKRAPALPSEPLDYLISYGISSIDINPLFSKVKDGLEVGNHPKRLVTAQFDIRIFMKPKHVFWCQSGPMAHEV